MNKEEEEDFTALNLSIVISGENARVVFDKFGTNAKGNREITACKMDYKFSELRDISKLAFDIRLVSFAEKILALCGEYEKI